MTLWEWIIIGESAYIIPMTTLFVYIWRKAGSPFK
jgi:hypothetical protein